MTLNGVMALILRYFTKFVHDVVVQQLLGLPRFQNLLLIVYDHIIRSARLFSDYLVKTGAGNILHFRLYLPTPIHPDEFLVPAGRPILFSTTSP